MTDSKRNEKFMAFCLPERQRNIKQLIREQRARAMQQEINEYMSKRPYFEGRIARTLSELED